MQRGGRGNSDFFGFSDPLAGFEGFGRSGSLFARAFGGRDPFDDPFFTRPFGSLLGPNMFGPSIFDTLQSPFEHTQNTGFLENQAPSHNIARGPIIQELDPDEDEVAESLNNVSQDQIREHHTSGEPRIQHPDEEMEDVGKNNHSQYMHYYTGAGPITAQPQRSAYTFQSSSVTYGGTNGAYYTSSATRRTGGDGVTMEERKEADVTTGKATHRVSRGLHGKGHSVTRKLNSDGKVDTMQTLHNLNEDELAGFEEAWKGNAGQHLPGWNHDADMLYRRRQLSGTMDNDSAFVCKREPVEVSEEFRTYDDDCFTSFSDSELDLLISLKELAISRAKSKGCEGCAKMIGLNTLRGLGVILSEDLKERMRDKSLLQASFKGINPLDTLNLMKSNKAKDLESTRILDARRSELATPITKNTSRWSRHGWRTGSPVQRASTTGIRWEETADKSIWKSS